MRKTRASCILLGYLGSVDRCQREWIFIILEWICRWGQLQMCVRVYVLVGGRQSHVMGESEFSGIGPVKAGLSPLHYRLLYLRYSPDSTAYVYGENDRVTP